MLIETTRFGPIQVSAEDVIYFAAGLPGLEDCRRWVLLADAHNDALGWLQSQSRPEIAMAVVSPRRFVRDYQVRVPRYELVPLHLKHIQEAQVVVILGRNDSTITVNLKAPVVINLDRRLARQVVNNLNYPVDFALERDVVPLRKSA